MELLPEVEREQLKSGNLIEDAATSHGVAEIPNKFDVHQVQDSTSTSLLIPSSANPSLMLHKDHTPTLLGSSTLATSAKIGTPFPTTGPELGNFINSSHPHEGLLTNNERVSSRQAKIGKILRYDNTPTPRNHRIRRMNGSPPKAFSRSAVPRKMCETKYCLELNETCFLAMINLPVPCSPGRLQLILLLDPRSTLLKNLQMTSQICIIVRMYNHIKMIIVGMSCLLMIQWMFL